VKTDVKAELTMKENIAFALNLTICIISLIIPAISISGTIYRCDDKGKVTFSQAPCGDTFEVIQNESSNTETDEYNDSSDLNRISAESSLKSAEIDIRNMKMNIKRLEDTFNSLEKKRDEKLAKLDERLQGELIKKFQYEIVAEIEETKAKYWKDRKTYADLIHKYRMDLIDRERAYRIQASKLNKSLPKRDATWCPCDGKYNCYDESNLRYCITTNGLKRYRGLK
jgi:hypothetical protein